MKWLAAVTVVLFGLAIPVEAGAATEHLHGVILGLTPQNGEAVVRHDAFGRMPSMTMPFRVVPRDRVNQLEPGNTIDATVDTHTDPWTLRNIVVETTQRMTAAVAAPNVVPLRLGDFVPDVNFVDQRGRPFRFSQYRGQDVVLAFIYTRCQDPQMCPLVSAKFNALQRLRGRRRLHLVEVTLDPSYDRPPVLARYGAMFGAKPADWTLAVGDVQPTLNFAARFGIVAVPDPSVGIIHSENTVEIDPDGRIQAMYTDTTWQPADILADIDAGHHLATNPIARFDTWLARVADAFGGANITVANAAGDVAALLAIVAAIGYLLYRLARGIFAKGA
jgi:protein SCO1/2